MAKIVDADLFRTKPSVRSTGGNDGGNMDDVLRRLAVVESQLAKTRDDVSAIKAAVEHLATKADLGNLKAHVYTINATLPHLVSRVNINGARSDIGAFETRLFCWTVGTMVAALTVEFAIAKLLH